MKTKEQKELEQKKLDEYLGDFKQYYDTIRSKSYHINRHGTAMYQYKDDYFGNIMKPVLYKHGLPFDIDLALNIINIKKEILANFPGAIIIDAQMGQGKTTLATEICEFYDKKEFDFELQYAMGMQEFQKKLVECRKKGIKSIIYDDAGDFNRLSSMSKGNQLLNRIFETLRVFKMLVVFTLPVFYDLDKRLFLKGIPQMLIHCNSRRDTVRFGNYSCFAIPNMLKMKHYADTHRGKEHTIYFWQSNIRGHFCDLQPAKAKALNTLSTLGKKKIQEQAMLNAKGLISTKSLGEKLGKSKSWVAKEIKKMKIEPSEVSHRENYYNKNTYDLLMGRMVNKK